MITENEILTRVANAVDALGLNAYCTSVYEPFPPHFPCVYARMTDKYPVRRHIDLDYTDNQNNVTFTAEVFVQKTDGGKEKADAIMDTITDAFRRMYFIPTMRSPVDNGDPAIYRIMSRYRRVIASGDILPPEGE